MYLGSKIKRVGDVDKYFLGIDETLTSVAGNKHFMGDFHQYQIQWNFY